MPESFTDDELLALLARGLELTDPVPPEVIAAARAAYAWRTIDVELAEIVFDTRADTLVGMRSGEASRHVTFRSPGIEIEVMVTGEDRVDVVGQLVPPQEATVELVADGDVRTEATDRLGRFSFSGTPRGSVRIAVVTADGARIVTDRIEV